MKLDTYLIVVNRSSRTGWVASSLLNIGKFAPVYGKQRLYAELLIYQSKKIRVKTALEHKC